MSGQRDTDLKEKDKMNEFSNKVNDEVEENWASYDSFRDEIKEFYGESGFRNFSNCMNEIIELKGKITDEDRKSF